MRNQVTRLPKLRELSERLDFEGEIFGWPGVRTQVVQLIRIAEAADRVAEGLTLGDYLDNGAEADEIGLLELEAELGALK